MITKFLRQSIKVSNSYSRLAANTYRVSIRNSFSKCGIKTFNYRRGYTTEAEDEDLKKSAAKISEMFVKAQKYPEIGQQLQKIQSLFIEKGLVDPQNVTKKLSWSAQMKMLTDKDLRGAFMEFYRLLTVHNIQLTPEDIKLISRNARSLMENPTGTAESEKADVNPGASKKDSQDN